MTTPRFKSDSDLLSFAKEFLNRNEQKLIKDIQICLTANKNKKHAYFPALMTCFGYLEMLSGLHEGNTYPKEAGILKYANKFMDSSIYPEHIIKLIYQGIRHKVAHQAHPYFVTKFNHNNNQYRYIWHIAAGSFRPPIKFEPVKADILKDFTPPWPVGYDHKLSISIPSFKKDIVLSSQKYLTFLKSDTEAKKKFTKCAKCYFPP